MITILLLLACTGATRDGRSGSLTTRVHPTYRTWDVTCPATLTLPVGEPFLLRVLQSESADTGDGDMVPYRAPLRFHPGQSFTIRCDEETSDGRRLLVTYAWYEPEY